MKPDFTPSIYNYYRFKRYRKQNSKNYHQYRISMTSPFRSNKIISSREDEELANKLIRNGAKCIDVYDCKKDNNTVINIAVYRIEKWKKLDQ